MAELRLFWAISDGTASRFAYWGRSRSVIMEEEGEVLIYRSRCRGREGILVF